jgi:hypothetical protein
MLVIVLKGTEKNGQMIENFDVCQPEVLMRVLETGKYSVLTPLHGLIICAVSGLEVFRGL